MMKKKYIFLLVLVAAFAGFYYLTPSFESIVKQVVHKYGSAVTGTDVNLEGFNLKLADGEGHIGKITVGNPKNYKLKNAMELGGISVKVNIKSLTQDTIVIESVEIDKPVINYEILSLTQNNLSQLLENIKKNTASAEKAEQSAEKDSGGKKVIIKKLVVRGGEISVAASALLTVKSLTLKTSPKKISTMLSAVLRNASKKSASLANKYKKHKIPGYFRGFFYPTELIVHKSTNTVYERIS